MSTATQSLDLLDDFADFLLTQPTPEAIRNWHPSRAVQERVETLVDRKRNGETLSEEEEAELESAVQREFFIREIKARMKIVGRVQK